MIVRNLLFALTLLAGVASADQVAIQSGTIDRASIRQVLAVNTSDTATLPESLQNYLLFHAKLTVTEAVESAQGERTVSFTRNLKAYQIDGSKDLVSVPAHIARYSPDGLGILLEDAEKNELTYSEQMQHADWDYNNTATTFHDVADAPDGTHTADDVREVAADDSQGLYQQYTAGNVGIYVHSVFTRTALGRDIAMLGMWNNKGGVFYQYFDVAAGTVLSRSVTAGSKTVTFEGAGMIDYNGSSGNWWRLWIAFSVDDGAANHALTLGSALNDLQTTFTGEAGKGMLYWGAQVEMVTGTSFTSSYIQCVASAVTRPRDELSYIGEGNLPPEANVEGTFTAEVSNWRPRHATNGLVIRTDTGNSPYMFGLTRGSQLVVNPNDGLVTAGTLTGTTAKIAMAWDRQTGVDAYIDEVLVGSDASITGGDIGAFHIGGSSSFVSTINGFYRNIRVFNKKLSARELVLIP